MKTLTLDQALFVIAGRPDLALPAEGRPALSSWIVRQWSREDNGSLSISGEMVAKAEATFMELASDGKLTVLDEVDGEVRKVDPRWFDDAAFYYGGPPDFKTTLQRTDWDGSREMTEGGAVLTSRSVRTISGRVDADQLQEILNPPVGVEPEVKAGLSKPKAETGKVRPVVEQLKIVSAWRAGSRLRAAKSVGAKVDRYDASAGQKTGRGHSEKGDRRLQRFPAK